MATSGLVLSVVTDSVETLFPTVSSLETVAELSSTCAAGISIAICCELDSDVDSEGRTPGPRPRINVGRAVAVSEFGFTRTTLLEITRDLAIGIGDVACRPDKRAEKLIRNFGIFMNNYHWLLVLPDNDSMNDVTTIVVLPGNDSMACHLQKNNAT